MNATSHRRAGSRGAIRPVVRSLSWLILGLLLLYYLVTQNLATRDLVADLGEAKAATIVAREEASAERSALATQVQTLQDDLSDAQRDVAALTQQLITAGLVPALPPEEP